MPSEQRATETASGVTDRDLALAHTQTQTKFCALCHGTLSPSSIETEYNASGLQAMEDVLAEDEGVAVRDGRYMSIDVDIEADSDMGDAPADDALDMAALCSACRERAVAPYANGAQAVNGAVRGARYALSRPPMVVGLETTTVMPSPPPSLLDSPVPFIQERSSIPPAVAVSLPKLRPTVSIPPSPCDTPSSSSSPSETHLRKTIRDRSTSPVAFVRHASPSSATRYAPYHDEQLDPTLDITRLRVRSNGYKCLYPGASFKGTQKSGRNSYDVSVTIVVSCLFLLSFSRFHTSSGIQHVNSPDIYYTQDVDFSASFLCGYLRIRGLTDDWPELTTYFDAQIVGNRHGFLTQDWGATDKDDMTHWGRFASFQQVQGDMEEPRCTVKDNKRYGAVFMRWKERFLVPDHRVQDINGASFAGEQRLILFTLPNENVER